MTSSTITRSRKVSTEENKKTTLLVTVGSTLFQNLTDLILSTKFLDLLISLGITDLVIQYGKASITIPPHAQNVQKDAQGSCSFTYVDPGDGGALFVETFRYTDDFQGIVNDSNYVISHAGQSNSLFPLFMD